MNYEYEPHAFSKLYKGIPWEVCKKCGLLALRNDFTRWCIGKGCNAEDHKDYQKVKHRLTKGD